MVIEERVVNVVLVELLGGEHGRHDRDISLEHDVHHPLQDRVGHEAVLVNAAVDHEGRRDDHVVPPGLGQLLAVQRELERARQLVHIDGILAVTELGHALKESQLGAVDQIVVPGRHHEGHTDVTHRGTLSAPHDGREVERA